MANDLVTKKHCNGKHKELLDKIDSFSEVAFEVSSLSKHFSKEGIVHEIREHVKTTNGRVKSLEIWKAGLIGAWAVVTVVFPILFIYFMNDLRHDFGGMITTAINDYDEEIFEKIE